MYFGFRPTYPTYGMKVDNINNRNNLNLNTMNYSMNMNITNNSNKQRNRFSKEEDELLRMLVEEQEDNVDWNYVSSKMMGRTSRQCRERYRNYLRPNLVNGSWTDEEDQLLEKMYEKFGPQWSKIAQYFPKRSDVNIKNHHTCIVNRLSRQKKRKAISSSQTNENTNNTMFSFNDHQNELETEQEIMHPTPLAPNPMFASAQPIENTLIQPQMANRNQISPEPPFVSDPFIPNQMIQNTMVPNQMISNQMMPNTMISNQVVSMQMTSMPMVSNQGMSAPMQSNPIMPAQAPPPVEQEPVAAVPEQVETQLDIFEAATEAAPSNEQAATEEPATEQPAADATTYESSDNQPIPEEFFNNIDFTFGEMNFDDSYQNEMGYEI